MRKERDLDAGEQIRGVRGTDGGVADGKTQKKRGLASGPPGRKGTRTGRWSPAAAPCSVAKVNLRQHSGSAAACRTASAPLAMLYGSGQDRFTLFPPQKRFQN